MTVRSQEAAVAAEPAASLGSPPPQRRRQQHLMNMCDLFLRGRKCTCQSCNYIFIIFLNVYVIVSYFCGITTKKERIHLVKVNELHLEMLYRAT